MIDLGLWVSYIFFFAAIAGMVVFSLTNMLRDTKKAKGTLMGVGALLVLFALCYAISGNEILPKYEQLGISANQSKMIGAGLMMLYILGIGTLVLAIYTEFRKLFIKK